MANFVNVRDKDVLSSSILSQGKTSFKTAIYDITATNIKWTPIRNNIFTEEFNPKDFLIEESRLKKWLSLSYAITTKFDIIKDLKTIRVEFYAGKSKSKWKNRKKGIKTKSFWNTNRFNKENTNFKHELADSFTTRNLYFTISVHQR